MKLPPLLVCIDADVCLNYEIHTPTGAFKIAGGLHYLECFTKGNAKALDLIYAPSSNSIRSLPFASACQKVPSTMPGSYLSKADKNLAVAGLLRDGRPRVSQRVVAGCSGQNKDKIFYQVWEK